MKTVAKWVIIIWSVVCLVGIFFGLAKVGQIQTTTDAEKIGTAIGTSLGLGLWFIVWLAIAGPAALVYLVAGPKKAPPLAAPEPTRTCPQCGETIKAQAKVCRFCGHQLD